MELVCYMQAAVSLSPIGDIYLSLYLYRERGEKREREIGLGNLKLKEQISSLEIWVRVDESKICRLETQAEFLYCSRGRIASFLGNLSLCS